jgi:radical SAM protein with 4Fe4S-binding SPASM domain
MFERFFPKEPESGFILEVTARCNNHCLYCYNVWKCRGGAPGDMPARAWRSIVEKLRRETSAKLITVTGGEPLLKDDLPEIIDAISDLRISVNLITNGTLLSERNIARTKRATLYEVPLLSDKAEVHDHMAGNHAFERVLEGMAGLAEARAPFASVFVATALNAPDLSGACEMAIAMGASSLMYNPFNPGGEGLRHIDELSMPVETLRAHLDLLEGLSEKYGIPAHVGVPVLPCVLDTSAYKRVTFGNCPAGGEGAYYTIDPAGMLRLCNHSPAILGDFKAEPFRKLKASAAVRKFREAVPSKCAGCKFLPKCRGGCRAAAEQACGTWDVAGPVHGIRMRQSI